METHRFPFIRRFDAKVIAIPAFERREIISDEDGFGQLIASVGVASVTRLIDIFRGKMTAGLNIAFWRVLGIELGTLELGCTDARRCVDLPL